jgi:hypothetical protein
LKKKNEKIKDNYNDSYNNNNNGDTDVSPYGWDCVIYIYADKRNEKNLNFWNKKKELDYLRIYCDLKENPGKMVTENLHMVKPDTLKSLYKYLFILLDDCKLIPEYIERKNTKIKNTEITGNKEKYIFNLDRILRIMVTNKLTVASPMVMGANTGGGQKFRTIMQREPLPNTEGYISNFVEIFAWVVTVPAYTALWDLLYPTINPFGWGYDFWYD